MNRESVIKGLEPILGCAKQEKWGAWIETLENAIKLLKEQEAVKPYIDIDEAKCPICKVKLTRQELLGEDVLFEDFFDYCPRCGRKVKWQ